MSVRRHLAAFLKGLTKLLRILYRNYYEVKGGLAVLDGRVHGETREAATNESAQVAAQVTLERERCVGALRVVT
jgi:hypothetical protein